MAGLVALVGPEDRAPGEIQITDRVQRLVPHELIGIAQAVFVQHPELVEHDGIVHRAAEAEVVLAHGFQVAHEAEGAGAADFADVVLGREVQLDPGQRVRDGRMVELDREAEAEPVKRFEPGQLVAVAHFHRLADTDEALGCVLFDDPGRLQQEHEWPGRTVHDRHFRCGQIDHGIVDTEAGQRRHQVLDGLHLDAVAAQAGAERGLADQHCAGGQVHRRIEVDAAKGDPGVDRCRTQGQEDLFTAVQADAGGADDVLERALAKHACRISRD